MLAALGRPFDSEAFFFEFKWDGFRAGAYIEGGGHRLMSRTGLDVTEKYPGLRGLCSLPAGLALDGELVAFVAGRPDFEGLQRGRGRRAASIVLVVFDLLYVGFDSVMDLPFSERRALLEELLARHQGPELLLSEGLFSEGKNLFQKSRELGLEGVMAKRAASPYAAGKRNGSWLKIKHRHEAQLAIIGYIEKEGLDFTCLLVAGAELPGLEGDGKLRYVGRVGGGFTEGVRERLNELLRESPRSSPLVPCPESGSWIEPGLYCRVSFVELTSKGLLRWSVFEALIEA
jgi:bifunctional non-homologous end joining protein LigD